LRKNYTISKGNNKSDKHKLKTTKICARNLLFLYAFDLFFVTHFNCYIINVLIITDTPNSDFLLW